MLRLVNEQVEIAFGSHHLNGIINGNQVAWGFYCQDPYFLTLFPAGVVYSFSHFSPYVLHKQLLFQREVAKAVRAFVDRHTVM